jgi:DNA-binding GntR family transcriptional regulator
MADWCAYRLVARQDGKDPMADSTLHGQMTADLRTLITSGELKPGSPLPSESQLGERYGVSRPTVRRALQTLEQEGLISSHVGRGRIVRDRRAMVYRPQQEFEPRRSATMDRFTAALSQEGREPSQSIEVAVENASGLIAQRLGVAEGTPVVARKRVRFIDGEPFNINDTYYTLELAAGTAVMNPDDIPEGSNSIIEKLIGPEVRAVDEIYVRMPNPEETRRLTLSTGTPVAVHYCTGYTKENRVVRVEHFVIPGDRHVILFERVHPDRTAD